MRTSLTPTAAPRLGRLGEAMGLYIYCLVVETPCQALADTGSTITLFHPAVLPGTSEAASTSCQTTDVQLTSVTGGHTVMRGKRRLRVTLARRTAAR